VADRLAHGNRFLRGIRSRESRRQRNPCQRQNGEQQTESLHVPPTLFEVISSTANPGGSDSPFLREREESS
jgi:hypothetical protein